MQKPHSGRTRQRTGNDKLTHSATKRGPGRRHKGGKPGSRLTKPRKTRAYQALIAAWASKRITKAKLRDEHGAYTCIGSVYDVYAAEGEVVHPSSREHVFGGVVGNGGHHSYTAQRKWLAGISAQRGY